MADTKISGLTANTTPATTDLLVMVDDPSGTPATQKITIANFLKVLAGDRGDITVDSAGTGWTIDAGAVTLAKIVDATAQYKLLGRSSSGSGDWEEITSSANVFTLLGAATFAAFRSSLGLDTGDSPQFTGIELGHASDTTITRNAAGVLAVEGVVIPSISSTNTLTNKRITPRVGTVASSATPTINTDNVDIFTITALAVNITSMTTNLSGTPTDGQELIISIVGTATRTIAWGASYEDGGQALPVTTVGTQRLTVRLIWNAATSKWRCENSGCDNLYAELSADGKYQGEIEAGTAGATLAFGDLVYLQTADSRWELADADAESTCANRLGICVLAAAADGDPTVILTRGKVRADAAFPAMTIGAPVFVSTTAGDIQTTAPSGTADIIRIVGHGITADVLDFNPSPDYFEHV